MTLDATASCDAELHAAWRTNDPDAGAQLIAQYRPRLKSLGRTLGLTNADADDLAHEVLLSARRSSFVVRDGASYWSWLAVIARRRAARMRSVPQHKLGVRRHTTPWGGTCRRLLLEEIERMPASKREVFVRLAIGYNVRDIAAELGLEASAVHMRIHRGRKWLRKRGH